VSETRLRSLTIGLLVVAAAVSVVGKKADSPWLGWASFAVFLVAVGAYFRWRQAVRARVFNREAKTNDETRARPDQ
jgi:hypothetical protein